MNSSSLHEPMPLQEAIEQFLLHLQIERHLSKNTLEAYRRDLRQFHEHCQMLQIAHDNRAIAHMHISTFLSEQLKKQRKTRSLSRKLSALRTMYRYLLMQELVEVDITRNVDMPRYAQSIPRTLSLDEVEQLISEVSTGVWGADSRAELEDVTAAIGPGFDVSDHEAEVDTLGGLLFASLGRIPVRGEIIHAVDGFEIEVTDADPRRIKKVRISRRKAGGRRKVAGG